MLDSELPTPGLVPPAEAGKHFINIFLKEKGSLKQAVAMVCSISMI